MLQSHSCTKHSTGTVRPKISRAQRQFVVCKQTLDRQAPPHGQQRNIFENIVTTLLNRAASRRQRGVATCLDCRGTGYCGCSQCKGSGTTGPMNKSTISDNALKQNSGLGSEKGDRWLTTNRCMSCKGGGNITCGSCEGTGLRAPGLVDLDEQA